MFKKFKRDRQKGIIPAILAVIVAFASIVFILLIGALLFWIHHLVAGLIGGGNQPGGFYGAGNCSTTTNYGGLDIPAQKGKIVREQHWVTVSEPFPGGWPSSEKDQLDRHFQMTNFSVNCLGCPKEGWTPTAGGGHLGGGNTVKPSLIAEPWMMNMQWKKGGKLVPGPPPGTKMIITSTKTGKSVVAAAGYEWGPEENSRWIAGATSEVLKALGIDTDGEVTVGFSQYQNQPYGPVVCSSDGGTSKYVGKTAYPIKLPVTVGSTLHYCTAYRSDGCGVAGHRKFNHPNDRLGDAVDLVSGSSNTVFAVFDGRISGSNPIYLTSATNNGIFAIYGHSITTKSGNVKAGDVIGYYSSSVGHVHFEIWLNNNTSIQGDPSTLRGCRTNCGDSGQEAYNWSIWANMANYLGLSPK